MKIKKKSINHKLKLVTGITTLMLLGGCLNMKSTAQNDPKRPETEVSVSSYTGEGLKLDNGEKTDKIAQKHKKEIITDVEKFFLNKYKTKVKVNNIVGAVDGATVIVESLGKPHFYTYAIVPIDIEQEKVMTDGIWTQEGQVEGAIMDGIYGMIYEDEFKTLEAYLKQFANKYPVVFMKQEAIDKAAGDGFMTRYYYATVYDRSFTQLYEQYIKNPNTSSEQWKSAFKQTEHLPKDFIITIHLYMKEKDAEPEQKIFDQLKADIEKMDGLPMGMYSLNLHDNTVDKTNAINSKQNTIETFDKDYIPKK
ncbi:DUF1672 family protein [Fictibacillus barbaricus]|uniref:DUF1672 domain-containing protein n=1 Tax=Fictibacillus barbaricus TaxID=182136 RepID=A0ABU1U1B8_9BACL|nr:DUF1672 family protein [Fictibacillus barbaricus]MDR7073283.1 hypothetical protein [Fictibacillus barbaricus]